MNLNFFQALLLCLFAFSASATDSQPISTAEKKAYVFSVADIEDVNSSCEKEVIQKASEGNLESYKQLLAFQIIETLTLDKISKYHTLLTSGQQQFKDSDQLKFGSWELIQNYYDSYKTTKNLESSSRMHLKIIQMCFEQLDEFPELKENLSKSFIQFLQSINFSITQSATQKSGE